MKNIIIYNSDIIYVDDKFMNGIFTSDKLGNVCVTRYIFTNYCQSILELKINPRLLKNKNKLEVLENEMKLNYIKSL